MQSTCGESIFLKFKFVFYQAIELIKKCQKS